MRPAIAIVNSATDLELLCEAHKGVGLARVTLQFARANLKNQKPDNVKLWLDTGWDGFGEKSKSEEWNTYVRTFSNGEKLLAPSAWLQPDRNLICEFASSWLDRCAEFHPTTITVPSLPFGATADPQMAGKINKWLAEATHVWKASRKFPGKLIVPVTLTHQRQYMTKAERNKVVAACKRQVESAGADGYWVADASLADQDGAGTFSKRFPALVFLHDELLQGVPEVQERWAGPYWCMNLVLWSRGLATRPVIGVGGSYQYHPSGGFVRQAKVRHALLPLRRWAESAPGQIKQWLDLVLSKLSKTDLAYAYFADLRKRIDTLNDKALAKRQVAQAYDSWLLDLESTPDSGRALFLYQQLSSAYVLGRAFPDLPTNMTTARRPERVAQQHMLICL